MLRKLAKWFLVVALMVSIGGHWAILQTVAWGSMIVSFSQSDDLSVAVAKTFDGQHACKLCKVVAEGKKSEQSQSAAQAGVKLEFVWASAPVLICSPLSCDPIVEAPSALADLRSPPLLPPPIRA